MAEEFHLDFQERGGARARGRRLPRSHVEGEPALNVSRNGAGLFCGCRVWQQLEPDAVLTLPDGGRTVPFFDLFYQVDLIKSGMHHPDGMLWIRGRVATTGERSRKSR